MNWDMLDPPHGYNRSPLEFTAQAYALVRVVWPPFRVAHDSDAGGGRYYTRFATAFQVAHPYELAQLHERGYVARELLSGADRKRWQDSDDRPFWYQLTTKGRALLVNMANGQQRLGPFGEALALARREFVDLGHSLGVIADERWQQGPWATGGLTTLRG